MRFSRKMMVGAAACLLALLAVGCTGGSDEAVTTEAVTEKEEITTAAPEDTETTAETEVETETEYVPPFDPMTFEPTEVSDVNVAREGFGMASSSRIDAGYTNLNLNDGNLSTSFSTTEEAFVYQQHLLTLVLKYFNWEIMPRPSMHHYCLS